MSIIRQERPEIYTKFGDISRPSEKTVFLILFLLEQLNYDTELDWLDKSIIETQNNLALSGGFEIYKLCEVFGYSKKRMERRLSRIEKKMTIEYLRMN